MFSLDFDGQIGASARNHCATRRQLGGFEFGRTRGKHEEMRRRKPIVNEWDCNYRDKRNRQRHQNYRKEKLLMQQRRTTCIYCETGSHSTKKCTRVLDVASRCDILRKKGICLNSTPAGHRVSHCKSRPCFECRQKHHPSICESTRSSIDQLSTANKSSQDKMK